MITVMILNLVVPILTVLAFRFLGKNRGRSLTILPEIRMYGP